MSIRYFLTSIGMSTAATILFTLSGQVQASAENYQYQMKSSADAQSIRPTSVFDDGKATWFVIPSDPKSPPTVLYLTPDGKEKLPERFVTSPNADNSAITLIAFDVAKEWRIRKGAMVVGIKNMNFKDAVTVTDKERFVSKEDRKIQDDVENYLTRLNSVSNQVVIKMQSIDINPEKKRADFTYARFTKVIKNDAPYINFERVKGNLNYKYVQPPKENKAPQPEPLFQVESIEFSSVENK